MTAPITLGTEYAPLPLEPDPAVLGLVSMSVHSALGSAVAYHRPVRTSTRATILLHGAAGSWSTWTPLLAAAELADIPIINPVLVDMPGWGRGTLGDDPAARTIETVATLVRDVAEQLGYTEWDLVGHSMGGFIALHMASEWPQSVLSVGTVSATTWSVIESVAHPVRRFTLLPDSCAQRRSGRVRAALRPGAASSHPARSRHDGHRGLRPFRPGRAPVRHARGARFRPAAHRPLTTRTLPTRTLPTRTLPK